MDALKELSSQLTNNMTLAQPQTISIRWEHPSKQRYYHVLVAQDLFGDWVITKAWGGISQSSGRITHLFCTSSDSAFDILKKIIKTREQRGYILREQHED